MTKMSPLLERNEQFAATYTPGPLGPPAAQVVIVTCLDHRVDPAIILGLELGDAVVIRNTGGRVTQAVIDDIAYLGFLVGRMADGDAPAASMEVAIIHHTQCGTGPLADPGFRRQGTGLSGSAPFRPGRDRPGPAGADIERADAQLRRAGKARHQSRPSAPRARRPAQHAGRRGDDQGMGTGRRRTAGVAFDPCGDSRCLRSC